VQIIKLEIWFYGETLMPTANLTDRKIASLKPAIELIEWWDKSTPGFGIRVSPKGRKTWFVMYRIAGIRRRYRFGRYPEITLEAARKKARKALSDVSDGIDPAQEKKAQEVLLKQERLDAKTFVQLSRLYIDEYAKLNKRSWQEDERIIEKLLKPEFGALNVKDITRSHVRSFLRDMAAKTRVQANRAHACLRKIFNWAIREEIVDMEGNPASGISSPGGKEKPKERNLADEEIKAVWKEMETESTAPKRALQLILLTGQRPGEVVALPWEELNLNDALWMLPGSRSKNGLANIVPLSNQAFRIIEKQREALESQKQKREKRGKNVARSAFVFPCRHLATDKPMTVYAIDQEAQIIAQKLGISGFTPHDLRRTCSTKLGEMLVPGHLIDRITNHKPTGITDRVYNKYDYLREKQEALNAWGIRLTRLVSGFELVKAESNEG
jgi:integrase